jgi:hypothetical protein
MGAWKDVLIDMQDQQAADDWHRYEMERDDALSRRRELIQRAWGLHRGGMKLRRFFPDLGNFNISLAAEFRAEAREIRSHWR